MASLEGNPFIIRFKTWNMAETGKEQIRRLEGNPFIIRFKTAVRLLFT